MNFFARLSSLDSSGAKLVSLVLAGGALLSANAQAMTPDQMEFFEKRIRPVLAQECYECHSEAGKQKGGLLLDSRPGWQAGGDSGAAITPGDLAKSLLLDSIKHTHDDMKMPKNGAKLDDAVIADFEKWIAEGAYDPRDAAPSAAQLAKETDWSAVLERRKQWWCFQPVKTGALTGKESAPAVAAEIDQQLMEKLRAEGITPAGAAAPEVLIRRASYILTGLPPEPEAVAQFVQAWQAEKDKGGTGQATFESLIDRLLGGEAYGERWARHWLDWVRYAESYGSEGDPRIPYAWRYRDYVVRAMNADVPYPQMLREAIAGDLLSKPRLREGVNESALGIGQMRMVLHGFSPTDSLDELVAFTDNQIDTVTKTFQALTVSCARCHNHKFDAISQADFYSLYGIFTSSKPAVVDVNAPGVGEPVRAELRELKAELKKAMQAAWEEAAAKLPVRAEVAGEPLPASTTRSWDLLKDAWYLDGAGARQGVTKAGEFSVDLTGPGIIARLYPTGLFSDLLSPQERAVVMTPRFKNEGGTLWLRTAGDGGASAKYVVQNYPRTGTIHHAVAHRDGKNTALSWQRLDLNYWKGDDMFLQAATVADMPAEAKADARSWFGITAAYITSGDEAPPKVAVSGHALEAVRAWGEEALTDAQAELLAALLREGKLPNTVDQVPAAKDLLKRYRETEAKLPMPTRAPGALDADGHDAPLFVRGDHKQPAELVARRFLDGINPEVYTSKGSGRLELAQSLTAADNPLTSRVIVNRLWHHVFGRGLVGTTDNFGRLGELPSHPELLDALASYFQENGGSMKTMIKALMLTEAFQRSDQTPALAIEKDPQNHWLSHWTVRRLEAEAIRDSILKLSGKMDPQMYGEPVYGKDGRRSVYVGVVRNSLEPFLSAFDMPVPAVTRGNRDVTNVPAQSLALLNDPTIINWTANWARRALTVKDDEARVDAMFMQSLARKATAQERAASLAFVKSSTTFAEQRKMELAALEKQRGELQSRLQQILSPVRAALEGKLPEVNITDAPKAYAEWTFEDGGEDVEKRLPLKLEGGAKIEQGALVLDGRTAMARSAKLPQDLKDKTLEAWVVLDTLDQKGGGVVTVQDLRGNVFDSIVYAERAPQEWLSGSNNHRRTQEFGGPADSEADKRVVHVAISYEGNKVTGYRDGEPYGVPYTTKEVSRYAAGEAEVLLGCRHGAAVGNRVLRGRILRARLYDRALTDKEIALSRHLESSTITERDVLNALSAAQRQELDATKTALNQVIGQLNGLTESAAAIDPAKAGWESLALSLINLKEFIYLR